MYPLFGGYWGYQRAPLLKITEQRLVLIARKNVEAEIHANTQAEMDAQRREMETRR